MARKKAEKGPPKRRAGATPPRPRGGSPLPDRPVVAGIAQRFAEALLAGDRSTAFVQACVLMKQAIEAPEADQQLELGRQALAFSPDLADLYVELVELVRARREAVARHLKGAVDPQVAFGTPATTAEALAGPRPLGTVTPDWTRALGPVTSRHFGHNAVWVRGGLGLWDEARRVPDPEVLGRVTALKPGVLRFPGGTRAMRYHFDEAIGPPAGRRAQCDPFTGGRDATGYGLDEFLQLTLHVGAEVTLVAPWVDGTPEEAAALVAYANARPDSKVRIGVDDNGKDWRTAGFWAQRRADNGHPEPYGVPFLEIGNEQYLSTPTPPRVSCGRPVPFRQSERWVNGRPIPTTAADHAQQVARTGRLVRRVDPAILIGASAFAPRILIGAPDLGGSDAATAFAQNDRLTGDPWNVRLVREAGPEFDFFILHPYNLEVRLAFPDDPLVLAEGLRQTVRELRALDPTKQVAVTEFGSLFFGGSLLGVLLAAQVIRVSLEEQLLMTLRHLLIEDQPPVAGPVQEALLNRREPFAHSAALVPAVPSGGHLTMPGYWAMRLLAEHLAGAVVPATTDLPGTVAFATWDQQGGRAAVVMIRHRLFGLEWTARVGLPPGTWVGTAHTLSGPALFTPFTEIGGDRSGVGPASGSVAVDVPAHALVVFELSRT
jgi:hypothetical protein